MSLPFVALALVVGLWFVGLALAIPLDWLAWVGCSPVVSLVGVFYGVDLCSALRIVKVLLKCV
jgi:hypothetical protein